MYQQLQVTIIFFFFNPVHTFKCKFLPEKPSHPKIICSYLVIPLPVKLTHIINQSSVALHVPVFLPRMFHSPFITQWHPADIFETSISSLFLKEAFADLFTWWNLPFLLFIATHVSSIHIKFFTFGVLNFLNWVRYMLSTFLIRPQVPERQRWHQFLFRSVCWVSSSVHSVRTR